MSPIRKAKYTIPDLQSAGFGNVVGEVGAVESTPVGAHVGGDGVAFPVDEQAANDSPRATTPKTLNRPVTDQIVGPYPTTISDPAKVLRLVLGPSDRKRVPWAGLTGVRHPGRRPGHQLLKGWISQPSTATFRSVVLRLRRWPSPRSLFNA